MIKLKDVIHLYLGCQVRVSKREYPGNELTGRIVEVTHRSNHGDWVVVTFDIVERVMDENHNIHASTMHSYFIGYDNIKPILRPLSDMTDGEGMECFRAGESNWRQRHEEYNVKQFIWLLSRHFDIFGLIESGQALDATKI